MRVSYNTHSSFIVFSVYKRNGSVYTEIVPNCSRKTLYAIIKGRVDAASVIHTDGFRSYDGMVDLGYQKHYGINHSAEFAIGFNSRTRIYKVMLKITRQSMFC